MRKTLVLVCNKPAGILEELESGFCFSYFPDYKEQPVSLTMPMTQTIYTFKQFPAFFQNLLPEGIYLEALLQKYKLDKTDYLGQLIEVGMDMVGAVTVEKIA